MGCEKEFIKSSVGKKILSSYIVGLLLLTSFIVVIPIASAEGYDTITTYLEEEGVISPETEFEEGEMVIVNISNNKTGNPAQPYQLNVTSETGEWIWVHVFDNKTGSPLDGYNTNNDGFHWGAFQIGENETNQSGSPPYLHLDDKKYANISEISGGNFDGDSDIAFAIITANYSGGMPPLNTTLIGHVNDSGGGNLENVNVSANNQSYGLVNWTFTDSGGNYELTITGGEYNISFMKGGYNPEFYQGGFDENGSYWVNKTLHPSGGGGMPPLNTTLIGHVNDSGGGNLENVNVSANNQSYGLVNWTFTDSGGNYELTITGGEYNISFMKGGYNPEFYQGGFDENGSYWVNKTLHPSGGGGDENPLVNTTIYGYVNDSNGVFLEGVNVSAFNMSYNWGNYTFSNETGYFEFKVFGGYFEFRAEKGGFEPWQNYRSWPENDTFVEYITLLSGGSEGENITVNITIFGTVYQDYTPDLPVPNANVTAFVTANPGTVLNYSITDEEGYFEMIVQIDANEEEIFSLDLQLNIEADGYEFSDEFHPQNNVGHLIQDMNCEWDACEGGGIYLEKIWDTINRVLGYVKNDTDAAIANATVMVEGPDYFFNMTKTNETGYFEMNVITGEFEFYIHKEGFFINCSEDITIEESVTNLGTFYLEEIPDYTAWINGTLTSNGTPLQYTEIMLFDPLHSNEGEKEDMPLTDGNGYFNISTYPGEFKLVTTARVIGKQMDAPPIGIGGYQNNVFDVIVNESESKNIDINLSEALPDNISIDMAFSNWSYGTVAMTRAIIGNAKIIRTMIDEDINDIISEDEIQLLIEDINESLSGMEHFDEIFIFAGIPFEVEIDEKDLRITNPSVEINGITNGSSIDSFDVITVFINGTLVASGEINGSSEIHSVTVECYYGNPAFEINYTVNCPNNYTFIDSTNEYVTVTGLDTANVNIVPDEDPDMDDKTFSEGVSLLAIASGSQIFAEMLTYYEEIPFDSDGDGDYDYLITKFKFNTSEDGDFNVYGVLKSQSGTTLGENDISSFYLTGSNMAELSFDGYRINKKQKDGPYRVIANLYYKQGDSYIWIDSINKTTDNYNYTDFTSPPLYFTGQISDTTVDEDEDGLYDSLIISVEVSVGDTGNYEMEADIGICDFSYQGDPHIAHIRKDATFVDAGSQSFNFTFDGSLIYRKGSNSSLWVNIQARSYTEGRLDELQYMTEKYYYTDFERPLPESCSISGNVTDVFGNPLEAEIRLMNMEIYGENNTQTNDNGSFSINCQPGKYELDVWCTNYSSSYENQWETIIIGEEDENETIDRNIILLPYWHECTWLDWMMDSWQYASGDPIYVNITAHGMGNSNSTLEVYKEEQEGDFWGRRLITSMSNTTDINGSVMYAINTSTFSNGQYMFQMLVYNESLPQPNVARGDAWGIQISSIALDFDIDRWNYRPGSTGEGTYTLTYINNETEVINATYGWEIMYWDWMGEHVLASDTFTNNASGNGSFDFTIPPNILDHGDWFDLKFTATDPSGNEIQSWRGFGITTGSCIESVTDSGVGTEGNYDGLALNVTVNVTQGGNYRINGGLNDQSWWWIAGNETEQYLNEGSNTVWIYIEGEQIQNSGKDGPYRVWVGLYNSGDWNELDNYEYTTDTAYNHNNFCRPDVYFNTSTELTYYTVGDVDDYEALIVNASIVSSVAGNYTVHGNLHHKEQQSGGWDEWYFVAWNKSAKITIDEGQLNTTINVSIRFEGSEIYNSGRNGPYSLNFNLHKVINQDWEEWVSVYDPEDTIQLNYSQFTKPSAYVAGITDYGTDANDNLVIGVQINVSDGNQGNYRVNGNLHSAHNEGHMWITHSWNESTLENGTNIVNLTFSGSAIYSAGYDGQYSLHVDLERVDPWQWLGGREFDTDSHIHTDFSMPGAVFVGTHLDEGYDEDGDGFYDYVRITVPVSFNETGWYEVSGELYQAEDWNWHWITWGHTDFQASEGTQNITIDFSGCEIMKSGREGQYGVNLWLRSQGCELGNLDFTTDNSYYSDEFDQPAVSFTADSPRGDSLSPDNTSVDVTLAINSSEVGTYRVNGNLHKVIQHPGWDEWIWITHSERELTISQTGETEFNLSFDTAMIQGSGHDGPYTIDFDLMDENWMQLDFIRNYQSQSYSLSGLDDIRPAYFTGDYDDYLYPSTNPEFVKVNVTLQVNESGNYEICGDLHKDEDWNWNFIAGSGNNQYFDTGEQNITLQFDAIEILDNIENNNLNSFESGDTFDIDIWLRRSGEWMELDHLSNESKNTYMTSDFSSSFGASIEEVNDSGYNSTGDEKYEYLNVTVEVNFTQTGNYELWCDLSKESGYNWYWIGWKNEYIAITSPETRNVTLQFSGERISSAGHDGPYKLYMELMDLDSGKRIDRYNGETESYSVSDFIGSSVEFNDSTISVEGVDTDDAGTEYDYLLVSVNVTSESSCNVEFRGDLHKESQYSGWQWISCQNNWTSLEAGDNTLTLRFDGGIIRNSGIDGPYQIRLELWDTSEWKLLDVIDSLDTPAYSWDNFQASSAEIVEENISDWGLDVDGDGKYEYLEVNVSVNVANAGNYEVMGDLHSDTDGWYWLGWKNNWTYLESGNQTVKLRFNGAQIKSKGINGPYKIRIELRANNGNMLDMFEPYETESYSYGDFQSSGVELVGASDRIIDDGDYLELNVTVDCSAAGDYWIGGDLHKESGWEWQWIAWESKDVYLDDSGNQTVTILFSGEMIYNSGIDGPYQIRIELRDTDTWEEQDMIERYNTQEYSYSNFSTPSVSFVSIEDSGNDTDSSGDYNYLDLNVTVNCTSGGTYWLNADLHKESGWNWQWIAWKGEEISLTGEGEQVVKIQFDGEQIYNREINGPYQVRLEIRNITTGTQLDTYEQYNTQSYNYDNFTRSSIEFVENDDSPSDRGIGTEGSYSYLEINVTINSTTPGTYWLNADLQKQSEWNWQWVAWQGQEITHSGGGEENFTILFDGSLIRNNGIDGPYKLRLELNSANGEWKQYDVIEGYDTNAYDSTDFQSAGVELVEASDGTVDSIANGNLQINVTVNSSTSGLYEIWGDLHKESGWNWQWISWNSTQITVDDSGEQTFSLLFDGGEIYDSGIDGPYHVRIELRNVGTGTMVDSIDRYATQTWNASDFSAPSAGINTSDTEDYATNEHLQVNVTTYSESSTEYQVDCWLHGENWEFIGWNKTTKTINGFNQQFEIKFDGNMINSSGIDPEKVYIEMRRTSDWKLIDDYDYDLQGSYGVDDFNAGIDIDTEAISSSVWDSDGDGYNDSLNVSVDIDFEAGTYEINAGLRDNATVSWITGASISPTSYSSGSEAITLSFDGLKIYSKGKNGPYLVSFISVSKEGIGEIARETNVHVTDDYDYTDFEHPDSNESANLTGTYSSYASDTDDDGDYDYLIVNVTVNVTTGSYDFFGDLYSSDGATWITSDSNNSVALNEGVQIVQLKFEGEDIYDSLTNGPYLLGYIRVSADMGGTWIVLDEESNVHNTSSYNYADFDSGPQEPTLSFSSSPERVSSITTSNNPFSPNSDGTKDTTLITVNATSGQTLYLNIYDSNSAIKRTGMPLSGNGETYTATWQGKDDNNTVVSDGTYRIKVSVESSGEQVNESGTTTTVVVDTSVPTGSSVTIDSGASYTTNTSVALSLTATDDSNKKMRFKNSGGNWTDWEDFQNSKSWTLTSTDGSKTVSFQAKDVAGNIATAVTDSITLDKTKPSNVNVSITGKGDTPSTYTNEVSVTLAISAEDATSGLEYMMISNDVSFTDRSWESYSTSKEWTLTSGDGTKTVYLKVKDRAGKVSDIVSDSITLDTTNPTGLSIQINSGQTYTNSSTVTLTLATTGAAKMQFSNDGTTWSSWESYSTEKTGWILSSGEGTKTVYFKAKDTAGNVATNVTDTITNDTTAPAISSVSSSGISQSSATIIWTTNEAATSYVEYGTTTSYGSNTTLDTDKVTSHSESISGLNPGTTYNYRVKSKDTAGNERTSSDYTFTTSSGSDSTAPDAIEGLTVTDKTDAEETLTLSWNESAASDFARYKVYRKTSSFTNVSSSGVQLLTTINTKSTTTYDDTTAEYDGTEFFYAVTAIDTATPPNENQDVTSVSGISVDDKAPVTTDNIPAGWQTSEVTVTLSASDGGEGFNKTYYTTDGSDPTNSSNTNRTESSSPTTIFTVGGDNPKGDGIWTIKYYSYDKNTTQNNESIHTKTLKVDTAGPATTDNAPSGWQTSSVTVTLTSTDATSGVNKIYYTKDGSTPTISSSQYSSPILFTSDGNRTLKYFAKDNATNTESNKTKNILLDSTSPTSSVGSLSASSSTPFNITWSSSDATSGIANVTIQYKNGSGGTWTNLSTNENASGTISFTTGANGSTYYFRSIATDNASNEESYEADDYDTYTAVVPGTLPVVEITSPIDDDGDGYIYVKGTITITGTAAGANFSKYWLNYSSDGSSWLPIENSTTQVASGTLGTLNTSTLEDTNYTLNLTAVNDAGSSNTITRNITVDNTNPNITSVSSGSIDENSAEITWTTDELANSTVEYGTSVSYGSTKSSSTFTTSHSVTLTGLSASTIYHYSVTSYDKTENFANSSDGTFTTSDEQQDGGGGGGGGLPPPVENETTEEVDEPPTISDIYHEPTTITSKDFVGIYATVTDDNTISSVKLGWDDGSSHSKSMTLKNNNIYFAEIGPFSDGMTVTYWITTTDNASQTTESSSSTFTVIDNAGPTITINKPLSGATVYDGTPTIKASYNDPSGINIISVSLTLDGESVTGWAKITSTTVTYTPLKALTYATHKVKVEVSDNLGYTESKEWSFTVEQSEYLVEEKLGNITGGETIEVTPEKSEETGIDSIGFTAATNLTDVKVTVAKLDDKPEGITTPTEKNVYAYLDIEFTADDEYVEDDSIHSLKIKFKIELTWFDENDIDKETIVLMRYHNDEWQELTTTYLNQDAVYSYFETESTGLSTFAITGEKSAETPPPSGVPWLLVIIAMFAVIIVVAVALLKTGVLTRKTK